MPITTKNNIPDTYKRNSNYLLGLGVLFVILGTIGLGMIVQITLISMLFFGVLLIVAGVGQLLDVFKSRYWKAALWHACVAILYIIGGSIIFYDPVFASTIITALLAWILILIGVIRLLMVFTLKGSTGYVLLFITAIFSILLGCIILLQWPISGLWVIGLFITIELMITGWAYIFMAIALKSA